MKKNLLSLAAILSIGFFTSNVEAQTSATVSATTAGAKLIKPMTLSETSPLHFGTINVLSGAAGTVLLPSSSTSRVPNGGVALSTVAPTATNAAYDVTGTKLTTYALTLPGTINVEETSNSAQKMIVSDLTAKFNFAGIDKTTSTLDIDGKDSFTVGGTLNVGLNQLPGIYAGTFQVSVDYN